MAAPLKYPVAAVVGIIVTFGSVARSQPVLIANSDVAVGPLDTQILDQQTNTMVNLETARITVLGRTLTINGRHRIASLLVNSNDQNLAGRVTHDPGFSFDYDPGDGQDIVKGMHLIVTDNVTLLGPGGTIVGGFITANACGYAANTGPGVPGECESNEPGGAGHGGWGGNGRGCTGGVPYGSLTTPNDFGSGNSGATCGAAGGGMIRLEVGGVLTVNGSITANGGSCSSGGSGAAGGSIWITCGQFSGYGKFAANGGSAYQSNRGGGSGGRIAVYSNSSGFTGSFTTYGGSGQASGTSGASGTTWTKTASAPGSLAVAQGGAITPLPDDIVEMDVLTTSHCRLLVEHPLILNSAMLYGSLITTSGAIQLRVSGDLLVGNGCFLSVDAQGYAPGTGPGKGGVCTWPGGSGYGGTGGQGRNGCARGPSYGSLTKPTSPGSGGSGSNSDSLCGGRGGGVVRLIVGGTLTINGTVSANAQGAVCEGGGASAGSIWITCRSLAGSGYLGARGSDGATDTDGNQAGGAGGGGRMAIYACGMTLPTTHITVTQGFGYFDPDPAMRARPGTVFYGSSSVRVVQQPSDRSTSVGRPVTLEVVAQTSQPDPTLHYQWRRRDPSGEYVPVVEGGRFAGVTTPMLSISDLACADSGVYDCFISDACGWFPTDDATLTVTNPADFNTDGQIDFFDYLDFAAAFDTEDPAADFNADNQIDFFDYLDFVQAFDAGCE
jgi:hypothetical protein